MTHTTPDRPERLSLDTKGDLFAKMPDSAVGAGIDMSTMAAIIVIPIEGTPGIIPGRLKLSTKANREALAYRLELLAQAARDGSLA